MVPVNVKTRMAVQKHLPPESVRSLPRRLARVGESWGLLYEAIEGFTRAAFERSRGKGGIKILLFRPMPLAARSVPAILTLSFLLSVVEASELVPIPAHFLMPVPAELSFGSGRLPVTADFQIAVRGCDDARLQAGLKRALKRWEKV